MQSSEAPDQKLLQQGEPAQIVGEQSPVGEDDVDKTFENPIDMRMTAQFARLSEDASGMVGKTLNDHFEIISLIGEGGMSHVYKASDILLKKVVAVKMLRPHLLQHPNAIRRLQQEARATSHLDHPNTVGIRHFDMTPEGAPYLVMDYVNGRSLAEIMAKEEKFEPERAIRIFVQIAAALAHAHAKGIIHRDLKANNVLLMNAGESADVVKIVDFGIAKLIAPENPNSTSNVTMTGEIFGSPLAMSPEQCRGEKADARSDIYSFGCLMYEMLTGKPVFSASNSLEILFKQLHDMPDSFKVANPSAKIPPRLEAITFKALQKELKQRYQSMEALLDDLLVLDKTSTMDVAVARLKLAAQNTKRIKRGLVAVAIATALAAGAFLTLQHVLFSEKTLLDVVLPWQSDNPQVADPMPVDTRRLQINKAVQEKAINKAKEYIKTLKQSPRKDGTLDLTAAQAVAAITRLREDAHSLFTLGAYDELKDVVTSASCAASTYARSVEVERPGNAEQGKEVTEALREMADDLFKLKLFAQAQHAYESARQVSDNITGPQSSDAGYFRKMRGDCHHKMAEYGQSFATTSYSDASDEYKQFIADPPNKRILAPDASYPSIQQQKAISYWRKADCERMEQKSNEAIDDYGYGLENDHELNLKNRALCHAYMAALAKKFGIASEKWPEIQAPKEGQEQTDYNPVGGALIEMQKQFGTDDSATLLLEREYANCLWRDGSKLVSEGKLMESARKYWQATATWLHSKFHK